MTETSSSGPAGATGEARADTKSRVTDGIKQGLGVLSAFKDAIEETIADARERGDLTPERARDALRSALARAQDAVGDAKERLDLVTHRDLEALRSEVQELRGRIEALEERTAPGGGAGAGKLDGSGA